MTNSENKEQYEKRTRELKDERQGYINTYKMLVSSVDYKTYQKVRKTYTKHINELNERQEDLLLNFKAGIDIS